MICINIPMPKDCSECMFSNYGYDLCIFGANDTLAEWKKMTKEEQEENLNSRNKKCPLTELKETLIIDDDGVMHEVYKEIKDDKD